jgi:transcription-repair coupling factor (superfamily II helicase)
MPTAAQALFGSALLRVLGAALGVDGVLVRASEARISFRADALPRLKGLSVAFHDVQFQVDVRRTQPLALKLTRLGGAEMLDGLVRALRALAP